MASTTALDTKKKKKKKNKGKNVVGHCSIHDPLQMLSTKE